MNNLSNQSEQQLAKPSHSERVAVLLAGYGEVQNYKDFTQYNQRASAYIAAKFAPIPSWLYPVVARILTVQDLLKSKYQHHNFISPQNDIFEQQREGLERLLQERWHDDIKVFTGFYFCEPFVEKVLAEIKSQGFRKLLVYPLLVVNSVFTSSIAIELVNKAIANFQDDGQPWFTDLRYIPSFATQPEYIDLMVRQIEEAIAKDLAGQFLSSQIGIVLEVHGGPAKTKGLITGVEDGQALYDRVQARLINQYPLISVGWINHKTPLVQWSEPDLKQAGKNLIELGAKVILFKSIGWATENYETILDVEEAIADLRRRYPDINYIRLGCANEHPDFLKMLAELANPQIATLIQSHPPLVTAL